MLVVACGALRAAAQPRGPGSPPAVPFRTEPAVRDLRFTHLTAREGLSQGCVRHQDLHDPRNPDTLGYDSERFRLRVRDDGRGIDQAVLAARGIEGHFGLRGMPERAALIGGTRAVWSEVGAGTELELRLPAGAVYADAARRSWPSRLFKPRKSSS